MAAKKKATPKKQLAKKVSSPAEVIPVQSPLMEQSQIELTTKKKFFSKRIFILLFILLLAGFGFYYLRTWLIVAEVNGKPISRLELYNQLEMQAGQQVLNALIAKSLILQEGESKGVIVTQKELDEKVKKLEKTFSRQGQTLDQYLQARKMSRQSFLEEIKIQIVIEKLLGKDIAVSDKEIHDYIEQNKDALPKDVKPEDIKEQVAQELVNQKIQMKIPALLQNLQKKYKVNRFLGGSSTIMPQ